MDQLMILCTIFEYHLVVYRLFNEYTNQINL